LLFNLRKKIKLFIIIVLISKKKNYFKKINILQIYKYLQCILHKKYYLVSIFNINIATKTESTIGKVKKNNFKTIYISFFASQFYYGPCQVRISEDLGKWGAEYK
jgi:Na+/H+ antiporter NhaC